MNCCTAACSWCGRCTDGIGEEPEYPEYRCEQCGKDVDEGDVLRTPYGDYCSDECASVARVFYQG